MNGENRKIKIFAGNSNKDLALKICEELGVPLGTADVDSFSDGEIAVDINDKGELITLTTSA